MTGRTVPAEALAGALEGLRYARGCLGPVESIAINQDIADAEAALADARDLPDADTWEKWRTALLAAYQEGYDFGVATTQGFTSGEVEDAFNQYMQGLISTVTTTPWEEVPDER